MSNVFFETVKLCLRRQPELSKQCRAHDPLLDPEMNREQEKWLKETKEQAYLLVVKVS